MNSFYGNFSKFHLNHGTLFKYDNCPAIDCSNISDGLSTFI